MNLYILKAILNSKILVNICRLKGNIHYYQLILKNTAFLYPVLKILSKSSITQLINFIDIVVIDYPSKLNRFSIIYILQSIFFQYRLNLKVFCQDNNPINSIAQLFPGSIWFEREVWDMYGIFFINNPDLRRILTDYGFRGFPLRKDFPLSGFVEVRYDDTNEYIVYEPVELMQEFRNFEFLSP